ncbi:fimbrial chaperone [Salmonella enterica]|nr:fimbrial chaperone [Salmonella enterica]EHF6857070.1 fimbrial chaperone [Salmonella enterica subsp. enterica serovar Panama]
MMKFRKYILLAAALFISTQSMAAFTLNGTRIIFDGGNKNTSFEVTNHSPDTWGGQVWIDNVSMAADTVALIPAPTFFKVNGNQKQVVRILDVNDDLLPKDRESLFYLNVQEIPPAPREGQSVLSLAMNTQVKLIYRPKSLVVGRASAEKKLRLENRGEVSVLVNPTPYYFAVVALHRGSSEKGPVIKIKSSDMKALSTMAPYSEVSLGQRIQLPVTVEAIDDYGGTRSYVPDSRAGDEGPEGH